MKLVALFLHRCPKCGKGKFFTQPITRIGQLLSMHEKCNHCGLNYEIEPGFFYGSMYVSYGLAILFSGITFGLFCLAQFFLHEQVNTLFEAIKKVSLIDFVFTNIAVLLFFLPYISRTARIIWLSLFIKK